MKKHRPYPVSICGSCGVKHGRREAGIATFYAGVCGVCGKSCVVTEPRDYGHLKEWPVREVRGAE